MDKTEKPLQDRNRRIPFPLESSISSNNLLRENSYLQPFKLLTNINHNSTASLHVEPDRERERERERLYIIHQQRKLQRKKKDEEVRTAWTVGHGNDLRTDLDPMDIDIDIENIGIDLAFGFEFKITEETNNSDSDIKPPISNSNLKKYSPLHCIAPIRIFSPCPYNSIYNSFLSHSKVALDKVMSLQAQFTMSPLSLPFIDSSSLSSGNIAADILDQDDDSDKDNDNESEPIYPQGKTEFNEYDTRNHSEKEDEQEEKDKVSVKVKVEPNFINVDQGHDQFDFHVDVHDQKVNVKVEKDSSPYERPDIFWNSGTHGQLRKKIKIDDGSSSGSLKTVSIPLPESSQLSKPKFENETKTKTEVRCGKSMLKSNKSKSKVELIEIYRQRSTKGENEVEKRSVNNTVTSASVSLQDSVSNKVIARSHQILLPQQQQRQCQDQESERLQLVKIERKEDDSQIFCFKARTANIMYRCKSSQEACPQANRNRNRDLTVGKKIQNQSRRNPINSSSFSKKKTRTSKNSLRISSTDNTKKLLLPIDSKPNVSSNTKVIGTGISHEPGGSIPAILRVRRKP